MADQDPFFAPEVSPPKRATGAAVEARWKELHARFGGHWKKTPDVWLKLLPAATGPDGYPIPPRKRRRTSIYLMPDPHRRRVFLQFYDWSGGNVGFACSEALIGRPTFEKWKTEPEFLAKLAEFDAAIFDRIVFRAAQLSGLIPCPKSLVVNPSTVALLLRLKRPDVVEEGITESEKSLNGRQDYKVTFGSQLPREGSGAGAEKA